MSETKTETVATQFGNVEVETVDCDSCGATIKKENAKKFVIGEFDETVNTNSTSRTSYRFEEGSTNEGWACEFCRDEQPADFPTEKYSPLTIIKIGAITIFFPLIIPFWYNSLEGEVRDFALIMIVGSIWWTAIISTVAFLTIA